MRDLRTYITGMGSSGALLGAILIAFATLAGIVAFNGMPGGSTDQTGVGDDVFVRADPALGAPAGPDRDRTRGNARDRSDSRGRTSPGGDARSAPTPVAVEPPGSAPPATSDPEPPSRTDPPHPPSSEPPAPTPTPTPVQPPSQEGDLGGLVSEVDDTVAGATGIEPGLGSATEPITDPVDDVIKGLSDGSGLGVGEIDLTETLKAVGS